MCDPFKPDGTAVCPYNNSHIIASSRLQKHLIKCSKNYPPDYMKTCPYNATHRLFDHELEEHVAYKCPDRQLLDPVLHVHFSNHGTLRTSFDVEKNSNIVCDESWDENESSVSAVVPVARRRLKLPSTNGDPQHRSAFENIGRRQEPMGYPEAFLREETGDSAVEDIESVASCATVMGRGKLMTSNDKVLQKMGMGRGSAQIHNK